MLILLSGTDFCRTTQSLWGLLGIAITAIKVVIPIILIVMGMLDMGKAVTSGKDDEIKKQLKVFLFRAVAAILVFFVPTIVGMIMQSVNSATNANSDDICGYKECIKSATGVDANCN